MTPRRRALAYLAAAPYFAACLLSARADAEVPTSVQGAAAWGMGASLALSAVWWGRGAGSTPSKHRTSERKQ